MTIESEIGELDSITTPAVRKTGQVRRISGQPWMFTVESGTGSGQQYVVDVRGPSCSCPDWLFRVEVVKCKHVLAVEKFQTPVACRTCGRSDGWNSDLQLGPEPELVQDTIDFLSTIYKPRFPTSFVIRAEVLIDQWETSRATSHCTRSVK